MSMNIRDMTGEPRSDEDLQDAINAVSEIMVKQSTVLPLFTVHGMTIRDCLFELQSYCRILKELKSKKEEKVES